MHTAGAGPISVLATPYSLHPVSPGPKAVLSFLRAQLRKAERCRLVKMVIVGPPRQGKSSLLDILQTGKVPQVLPSEATIRTTKWELQRPPGSKAKVRQEGACQTFPSLQTARLGFSLGVKEGLTSVCKPNLNPNPNP